MDLGKDQEFKDVLSYIASTRIDSATEDPVSKIKNKKTNKCVNGSSLSALFVTLAIISLF